MVKLYHCLLFLESKAKSGSHVWLYLLILAILVAGLFGVTYFLYKKNQENPQLSSLKYPQLEKEAEEEKAKKEAKRIPFGYEEQKSEPGEEVNMDDFQPKKDGNDEPEEVKKDMAEEKQEEPQDVETDQKQAEDENKGVEVKVEEIGHEEEKSEPDAEPKEKFEHDEDKCTNGHDLILSNDATGYQQGYYVCVVCKKVLSCSLKKRWNCPMCSYDICLECGPRQKKKPEEEKKEEPVYEIEQVIESPQLELAAGYRTEKGEGQAQWEKTHIIFAFDCSSNLPYALI